MAYETSRVRESFHGRGYHDRSFEDARGAGGPRARGPRMVPRRSDLRVGTGPRSTVQILGHRNSFLALLRYLRRKTKRKTREREKQIKGQKKQETRESGKRIKMEKGDNSPACCSTYIRKSLFLAPVLLFLLLSLILSPFPI